MRYEIGAMRVAKFGMVGLGALLAARVIVGCASDDGEPGYDAGTLPDVDIAGDSGSNEDTGALPSGDGGGADSTLSDDGGGSNDDGGDDTSMPDGSDGGHEVDASDGGHEVDASDGGHEVDASDAGHEVDASDGSSPALDSGEDSSTAVDAGQDSSSGIDAGDAAGPSCISCGTAVTFLGNTAAYATGGAAIALQSGTVPDGATVSITTQTYPQNSVTAGNAHLVYATDSNFTTQIDLPMTFDFQTGNNDQWYAVVPVQPANTTVYWYIHANGCDCTTVLYDNPGGLSSFTYTEQ